MAWTLDLEYWSRRAQEEKPWRNAYTEPRTPGERWQAIQEMYAIVMPDILKAAASRIRGKIDPYFLPWQFAPIEFIAWCSIRGFGTPLYPQVPVAGVFLDFANPYFRIGVELDGKEFHDVEKDTARDVRLMRQGWKIFRITGAEAYREYPTMCELEEQGLTDDEMHTRVAAWLFHTGNGVLKAIDEVFFNASQRPSKYFHLAVQSLDAHRLAPFSLPGWDDQRMYWDAAD